MEKVNTVKLLSLAIVPIFVFLIFTIYQANTLQLSAEEEKMLLGSLDKLAERSDDILYAVQEYNHSAIINSIGKNQMNGFYLFIADNMDIAIPEEQSITGESDSSQYLLDFDTSKIIESIGNVSISEGKLKMSGEANLKYNISDVMKRKDFGGIEITARNNDSEFILIGFIDDENISNWHSWSLKKVYLFNDWKFHTYAVDIFPLINIRDKGNEFKSLDITTVSETGEIEIDHIRILDKKTKYSSSYGADYEEKNHEVRSVIYIHTPQSLSYEIELPPEDIFFDFGLGVLEDHNVKFSVTINGKTVFSENISDSNSWQDFRVDLSEFSGRNVTVVLKADGAKGNVAFWTHPTIYSLPERKFNVIIILEDALRSDHMSSYGYGRNTTPFKDSFSKDGVLFENVFSQATVTISSCTSFMTSLYPTTTGVWSVIDRLDDSYITIAEIMKNQGFKTGSFTYNPNSGSRTGLHEGFDSVLQKNENGSTAENMYKNVLEWIDMNSDRNFFLYVHIIDPHGPYKPPEKFTLWYSEPASDDEVLPRLNGLDSVWVEKPTLDGRMALYDGEIAYNDYHFGQFIGKLDEMGIKDDTLIIFMSDHGEHFYEHGIWNHLPPSYIQTIKTPLIMVYDKTIPSDMRIKQNVQNLDIMPTILEISGINYDSIPIQGESLVTLIEGKNSDYWNNRVVVSEEVLNRSTGDRFVGWNSLLFSDKHFLRTEEFETSFSYLEDKDEQYPKEIGDELKKKMKDIVIRFEETNWMIHDNIVGGKIQNITYDQDPLLVLKALGYL